MGDIKILSRRTLHDLHKSGKRLGRGYSRSVVIHPKDLDLVIKKDFKDCTNNKAEAEAWEFLRDTPLGECLAPVVAVSPCYTYLVMARVHGDYTTNVDECHDDWWLPVKDSSVWSFFGLDPEDEDDASEMVDLLMDADLHDFNVLYDGVRDWVVDYGHLLAGQESGTVIRNSIDRYRSQKAAERRRRLAHTRYVAPTVTSAISLFRTTS